MKKLMMLLIAMINIFAFTSCNNEVADGTDDYTPSPDKDYFMPSINDVPGMLEGKCFKANQDGFTVHFNKDNGMVVESVNYQNFSITFKKNSILILTDDNDSSNFIELKYFEYVDTWESKGEEFSGTYIEYKDYKNSDETHKIELVFCGKQDNFCLGVLFHRSQEISFFNGALEFLYEVPIENGNDTDVLLSDIHKNHLNNTPTEEKLNAISNAYILIESYGGFDKNMYQYSIYKIDADKNMVTAYTLFDEARAKKMLEYGAKIVKTINNCSWIAPTGEISKKPFSELLNENDINISETSSYCVIDKALYEKYSDILPTGLF